VSGVSDWSKWGMREATRSVLAAVDEERVKSGDLILFHLTALSNYAVSQRDKTGSMRLSMYGLCLRAKMAEDGEYVAGSGSCDRGGLGVCRV
jgi:hypothetical protein